MVSWLVWLVGWLVGWSGWLVALVGWLVGWSGWLVALGGSWVSWLVWFGWLRGVGGWILPGSGWQVTCLADWLASWLVCMLARMQCWSGAVCSAQRDAGCRSHVARPSVPHQGKLSQPPSPVYLRTATDVPSTVPAPGHFPTLSPSPGTAPNPPALPAHTAEHRPSGLPPLKQVLNEVIMSSTSLAAGPPKAVSHDVFIYVFISP